MLKVKRNGIHLPDGRGPLPQLGYRMHNNSIAGKKNPEDEGRGDFDEKGQEGQERWQEET